MKQTLCVFVLCSALTVLVLFSPFSAISSTTGDSTSGAGAVLAVADAAITAMPTGKLATDASSKAAVSTSPHIDAKSDEGLGTLKGDRPQAKSIKPSGPVSDPKASVLEEDIAKKIGRGKPTAPGRRVHLLGLIPSKYKPGLYQGKKLAEGLAALQAKAVLPSAVDLSSDLPQVGDQGTQGACGAFAVGYYYKTYQEKQEYGWDVTSPDHQFSPSFLYNQVAPFNEGATLDEMFNLLMDKGCSTLADCPFVESDYTTWPSYNAFWSGIPHRIESYTRLGDGLTTGIVNAMKSRLAGGDLCVIGIPVYRPSPSSPGRFDVLDTSDYYYDMPGGPRFLQRRRSRYGCGRL